MCSQAWLWWFQDRERDRAQEKVSDGWERTSVGWSRRKFCFVRGHREIYFHVVSISNTVTTVRNDIPLLCQGHPDSKEQWIIHLIWISMFCVTWLMLQGVDISLWPNEGSVLLWKMDQWLFQHTDAPGSLNWRNIRLNFYFISPDEQWH